MWWEDAWEVVKILLLVACLGSCIWLLQTVQPWRGELIYNATGECLQLAVDPSRTTISEDHRPIRFLVMTPCYSMNVDAVNPANESQPAPASEPAP